MKKLYYFSKSKLQFMEVKHYKTKLFTFLSIGVLCIVALIFTIYSVSLSWFGIDTYTSLSNENRLLRDKLDKVVTQYQSLNNELESLVKINNELRIAANLEPISEDEQMIGVGGGYFDNTLDFLSVDSNLKLQQALNYMDEVTRKINFEKKQYFDISLKLKENEKLFEALPAIKPCEGTLAMNGFGMRIHPILNVKRMHDGIDIITDRGTPVYATGNGIAESVGYQGGLGLTIEIDHGFGYETLYGHLDKIDVRVGQIVKKGEEIGAVGSTGTSTAPHLHYEVHFKGKPINPIHYCMDGLTPKEYEEMVKMASEANKSFD